MILYSLVCILLLGSTLSCLELKKHCTPLVNRFFKIFNPPRSFCVLNLEKISPIFVYSIFLRNFCILFMFIPSSSFIWSAMSFWLPVLETFSPEIHYCSVDCSVFCWNTRCIRRSFFWNFYGFTTPRRHTRASCMIIIGLTIKSKKVLPRRSFATPFFYTTMKQNNKDIWGWFSFHSYSFHFEYICMYHSFKLIDATKKQGIWHSVKGQNECPGAAAWFCERKFIKHS